MLCVEAVYHERRFNGLLGVIRLGADAIHAAVRMMTICLVTNPSQHKSTIVLEIIWPAMLRFYDTFQGFDISTSLSSSIAEQSSLVGELSAALSGRIVNEIQVWNSGSTWTTSVSMQLRG